MNYWLEALESSLDENGAYSLISEEQRIAIAKDMEMAHEMHGEATGSINIPNPLAFDLKEKERQRERENKEAQQREDILKKCIAARYNNHVHVSIRDGRVEVEVAR